MKCCSLKRQALSLSLRQNISSGGDSSISGFVCTGQDVSSDFRTNSHVIKLALLDFETGFDTSETFAVSELSEKHAEILIETGEGFYFVVSPISFRALSE